MGQPLILSPLAQMRISPNFDVLVGMSGYIFVRTRLLFLFKQEQLGHCLGLAKNEGNEMAQWVLKDNDKVVPRRSICHLSAAKLAPSNEDKHSKQENFSTTICGLLGDSISLPVTPLHNLS
jgi:hypothetical protein